MTPLGWTWLGRLGYQDAWDLQEALRARILAGDDTAERLLFVEHDPVITLGRGAGGASVLASPEELARRGVALVRTSRGGDATVHGPGQLVIYPVVRLAGGVVRHVEAVAGAIVDELAARGIGNAAWRRDPAGVWVGDAKIAACGLHIRRRVAIHGFALNVTTAPLALFALIVPCGLVGSRVTSMANERADVAAPLAQLAACLAPRIARALGRDPIAKESSR